MNEVLKEYIKTNPKGIPLFTNDNLTKDAKNELDLIVRKVLSDKNVTNEEFTDRVNQYGLELTRLPKSVITNRRTNLLKAIQRGGITFNKFKECLCAIFKLRIINIKITFLDENDELYEINLKND